MITVEVAYAQPEQQVLIALRVADSCTVEQVIRLSGVLSQFSEIHLAENKVGIFGRRVTLDTLLQAGDRIEIYRPLIIDAKQARRLRARRAR